MKTYLVRWPNKGVTVIVATDIYSAMYEADRYANPWDGEWYRVSGPVSVDLEPKRRSDSWKLVEIGESLEERLLEIDDPELRTGMRKVKLPSVEKFYERVHGVSPAVQADASAIV